VTLAPSMPSHYTQQYNLYTQLEATSVAARGVVCWCAVHVHRNELQRSTTHHSATCQTHRQPATALLNIPHRSRRHYHHQQHAQLASEPRLVSVGTGVGSTAGRCSPSPIRESGNIAPGNFANSNVEICGFWCTMTVF